MAPSAEGMSCTSGAPVRYATGQIQLVESDIRSGGFGVAWGHQRSYGNKISEDGTGINGAGWRVRQLGYLQFDAGSGGNQIAVTLGADTVLWFQPNGTGGWEAVFTTRVDDRAVIDQGLLNFS